MFHFYSYGLDKLIRYQKRQEQGGNLSRTMKPSATPSLNGVSLRRCFADKKSDTFLEQSMETRNVFTEGLYK
jgi:hypothetical protein